MSTTETKAAEAGVTLWSCSEIIKLREARREARNGPQPWILRKLTVGIVVLIIGWVTYVYIGRVCVRMIRREEGVVGSRGLGSK
jgi:palmitoyltransferase